MKQNKEEWGVVMDKLKRVASLVNQVGTLCREHNLEEKDVPLGLRAIFESLIKYATNLWSCCRWLIALQ